MVERECYRDRGFVEREIVIEIKEFERESCRKRERCEASIEKVSEREEGRNLLV